VVGIPATLENYVELLGSNTYQTFFATRRSCRCSWYHHHADQRADAFRGAHEVLELGHAGDRRVLTYLVPDTLRSTAVQDIRAVLRFDRHQLINRWWALLVLYRRDHYCRSPPGS
jgi:hypothetical protein